eukprot:3137983-Prymnesium_polylepis.1
MFASLFRTRSPSADRVSTNFEAAWDDGTIQGSAVVLERPLSYRHARAGIQAGRGTLRGGFLLHQARGAGKPTAVRVSEMSVVMDVSMAGKHAFCIAT